MRWSSASRACRALLFLQTALVVAVVVVVKGARLPATDFASSTAHIDRPALNDLVHSVPGFDGPLPSRHRSGYVNVGNSGKRLFYYLVESEGDPATDPVVLWLNGGPGCSSFDGFVYEHGPFSFELQKAPAGGGAPGQHRGSPWAVGLGLNPHAWNKVANMLFLDSPAGVGLSYSTVGSSDYVTDDLVTRDDAHHFLRKWFKTHPEYQANPFYISGESYAGMYVPNLALAVAEGNEQGMLPHINLQGYLIGNGVTDQAVDGNALPAFASGKSLIPQTLVHSLAAACQGNYWNATSGSACDKLLNEVLKDVVKLNVYDVLEDCYRGPNPDAAAAATTTTAAHVPSSRAASTTASTTAARATAAGAGGTLPDLTAEQQEWVLQLQRMGRSNTMLQAYEMMVGGAASADSTSRSDADGDINSSSVSRVVSRGRGGLLGKRWPLVGTTPLAGQQVLNWAHLGLTPPCTDSRAAYLWLNDPVVRAALHAAPLEQAGEWTLCSNRLLYSRVVPSLLPTHQLLLTKHGLRALIFSGDHDMAVPHTGSEAWTSALGLPLRTPWRPWMVQAQVAGYCVEYEGLTYATVRGAGHMVPENKPLQALAMFSSFLAGKPLGM